jgi:endonuclease III
VAATDTGGAEVADTTSDTTSDTASDTAPDTTSETREVILKRLLERHGQTFAAELDIPLERGGAPELFQLLTAALLMSARIRSDVAVAAARALFEHGFTAAQAMADAGWQERVDALGEGSYVRYDESTATYLGDAAQLALDRYDGDLNQLRDAAEGDPRRIHSLLQDFKGIGRVGANIFCREAQHVWAELRPFVDDRALDIAEQLGLGSSAEEIVDLYGDDDLSIVTTALLRGERSDDLEAIRATPDGG